MATDLSIFRFVSLRPCHQPAGPGGQIELRLGADSTLFVLTEEVISRQEMWGVHNELKDLHTRDWVRIDLNKSAR
uniref:Uncharacterized protein n=1 Tax=Candidatus Kentrum sp. LPFa TaxID=2126335 RepID=A0A450XZM8_9GAMM|nr:MAG: hypothetical protein BECKLPF1236A_GA0070988_103083 [Candidatus Kentron sp. LPFa]VFK34751.1 MAG: hypothetical protein BECKLPF1236C_GA0070990_102963 [Candidatus Kentron sp. LPFa]